MEMSSVGRSGGRAVSQLIGHNQFSEMKACQSDELIFHVWSQTSAPKSKTIWQKTIVGVYNVIWSIDGFDSGF